MKITIYDTVSALQPFFIDDGHPKSRFERAKRTILAPSGLVPTLQGMEKQGVAILEAAQHDGYSVAVSQQVWGLFNPTRKREASVWVFEQLIEQQVLALTERWLGRLAVYFDADVLPAEITYYVLPGDPANRSLMINSHGLSCVSAKNNKLLMQLWPSENNLIRLGPALARMLVHQACWAQLPTDQPPTLQDYLVIEGLAAVFAETACPNLPHLPWQIPLYEPDGWADTLNQIAQTFYNMDDYSNVWVNIYGSTRRVGPERPPTPQLLNDEDREYAHAVIYEALSITEPYLIAAYLYGDEVVAAQGHPTVGLPPYAGFEVGYQMVKGGMEKNGYSISEAIRLPIERIIS